MNLVSVIGNILYEGCGISLKDALNSDRYQQLLRCERQLLVKYSRHSHRGIAYRVGHVRMGQLLNTFSEGEALARARDDIDSDTQNTEVRALIHYLGEQLVTAAELCLPDEVRQMARDWQEGDADQQLAIAQQLYFLFQGKGSDRQYTFKAWLDYQQYWQPMWWKEDEKRYLPQRYGKWGQGGEPNYQARTQLLAAFARLAGVRMYAVRPLITAAEVKDRWRESLYAMIGNDVRGRNIRFVDESFQKSFEIAQKWLTRLHHSDYLCILLRLCDGRWVLIDPYGLSWGVFSHAYDIDRIDQILTKYREVLPGLSLVCRDMTIEASLFESLLKESQYWIARSHKMGEVIGQCGKDITVITDALVASGDIVAIAEVLGKDADFLRTIETMSMDEQQCLARSLFWQVDVDPFPLLDLGRRIVTERDFIDKRIDTLLTMYHRIVLNLSRDQVSHEGLLVHPACEVCCTEYSIALDIVNPILRRIDTITVAKFFLDHQFTQSSLNHVLCQLSDSGGGPDGCNKRDRSLGLAAARALQALPVINSWYSRTLSIFSSVISENEGC